jgi:hypothetical protein
LATNENGTKAAHGCVKNITGLKFGDLYKRTKKKDIFKILNLAPYFMILKTITNSDRRKAELITDKEQLLLTTHTVQQASKKDYTTSIAPGIPIKPEEVSYTK